MKKLSLLANAKQLTKNEQKQINGGGKGCRDTCKTVQDCTLGNIIPIDWVICKNDCCMYAY